MCNRAGHILYLITDFRACKIVLEKPKGQIRLDDEGA